MNGCHGFSSLCDGRDMLPVRLGQRRDLVPFCGQCRRLAVSMCAALTVQERRMISMPVALERRRRRPEWLHRLTGSDRTGAILWGRS